MLIRVSYMKPNRKTFSLAWCKIVYLVRHLHWLFVTHTVFFAAEGKNAAKKYDCKYIEVSAAIDHKIDELLVGILKQIRLISDKYNKRRSKVSSIVHHVTGKGDCCPMGSSQSMLGKIFGKPRITSKSCDNLYVLWRQNKSELFV